MARRWSDPFGRWARTLTRARRLPARKALAAAIAVPLAATGMAFAVAGTAHAAAPAASVTICHSTNSAKNPYTNPTIVITDPTLNGHTSDTGPIYTTGAASWGDIIPPFSYTDKGGVVTNFPGLNWTATGQVILANNCNIPTTVTPVDPTLTQAGCAGIIPTQPSLTLATTPSGVTYSASPAGPYIAGETVTVTATTDAAHWFQAAPLGWTYVDLQHETYQFTFSAAPACVPIGPGLPITVAPVAPTVVDTVCVAGVLTTPTLVPAALPVGVTYTESAPAPYSPGQTVTVTASILVPGLFTFTAPAPAGWKYVNATTETYTITFANPACVPIGPGVPTTVTPVAPTVTNSACVAGAATTPSLALAGLPGGVLYTASAAAPYSAGQSLTVTASIIAPLLDTFVSPGMGGWTYVNATTETYPVTFAAAPACGGGGAGGAGVGAAVPTTVTPVSPSFGDPGCAATGVTAPFVTTPSTPAGVSYTVSPSGPYHGGDTVTVTATITDPADQFAAPGAGGWTFVDSTHETIAHTFAAAPTCSGVGGLKAVAATPTFSDATCVNGTQDGAFYTLPDMDGVRYVVDGKHRAAGSYAAVSGSTVTVRMVATAGFTLRNDGPVVHAFPAAPQCLGVEPASTSTQSLANTGTPVVPLAELGAVITVLGLVLMCGGRRRTRKAL